MLSALWLKPTNSLSAENFVHNDPRTDTPELKKGDLRIATFNVLNYFNGDGQGGGFPTSRGADSEEEFVAALLSSLTTELEPQAVKTRAGIAIKRPLVILLNCILCFLFIHKSLLVLTFYSKRLLF